MLLFGLSGNNRNTQSRVRSNSEQVISSDRSKHPYEYDILCFPFIIAKEVESDSKESAPFLIASPIANAGVN
jgi:hypothetical protein